MLGVASRQPETVDDQERESSHYSEMPEILSKDQCHFQDNVEESLETEYLSWLLSTPVANEVISCKHISTKLWLTFIDSYKHGNKLCEILEKHDGSITITPLDC